MAQNTNNFNFQYVSSSIINAVYNTTGISLSYQWTNSQGLALQMICGYFLGFMMCLGLCSLFLIPNYSESYIFPLVLYAICSSLFYTMEFVWHSLYHPNTLNISAFIIFNHSSAFYYALIGCFIEYLVEYLFFPSLKLFGKIHAFG